MNPDVALNEALAGFGGPRHAQAVAAVAHLATQAVLRGASAWAADALGRSLRKAPTEPLLLSRLAGVAKLQGDHATALRASLAALERAPGDALAATFAVELLTDRLEVSRAIAVARRCLAANPDAHPVRRAVAQAYLFQGRAPEAREAAAAAAQATPENAAAISVACLSALYDDRIEAREALQAVRRFASGVKPIGDAFEPRPRLPGACLRIGFLSPDFCEHPVGLFLQPIVAALCESPHDIRLYATGARNDPVTQAFRALPASWCDAHALDDAGLLAKLRGDALDVLVDLAGHTHGGRPRVVASRAARTQLAYLGFPCATGIANTDGVIACHDTVPDETAALYGTPVHRLPSYLPRPHAGVAPPVAARAADAPFVFASFNHLAKLSDATVALWSRVLHAVPDARLALCALALADRDTRVFTTQRFAAHGIDPARLVLLPPRQPISEFLRYYEGVDVALDPLPFNGGTTTAQAAWQGVPTLTRPGTLLASRMGAAIDRAIGDDAFVASDEDDYVARAVAARARAGELRAARPALRDRMDRSPRLSPRAVAEALADICERAVS